MQDKGSYTKSAAGMPYIPKVHTISTNDLTSLYRWRRDDTRVRIEHAECYSEGERFQSVVFKINPKEHPRRVSASLVGKSGCLAFGVLAVTTAPRLQYLVSAAIAYHGEWVDALTLESLFDYAVSSRETRQPPESALRQLDHGLECHRQLSLAHWQTQRSRLIAEIRDEYSEIHGNGGRRIDGHMRYNGNNVQPESMPDSLQIPTGYLTSTHTTPLNSKADAGEIARFLNRAHAEKPKYGLKRLFTIEWYVESVVQPPSRRRGTSTKRKS